MECPKFRLIRQKFERSIPPDAGKMVREELVRSNLLALVKKGDRMLITAGSRGIDCMNDVLRTCIAAVKEKGGRPFLFPSMGSHGRGDAPGQVEVFQHLGVTESSMGAPIYNGFDIVETG